MSLVVFFFLCLILCANGELQVATTFHLSWNKTPSGVNAVPNSRIQQASFNKCSFFHLLQFQSVVSNVVVFFILFIVDFVFLSLFFNFCSVLVVSVFQLCLYHLVTKPHLCQPPIHHTLAQKF